MGGSVAPVAIIDEPGADRGPESQERERRDKHESRVDGHRVQFKFSLERLQHIPGCGADGF